MKLWCRHKWETIAVARDYDYEADEAYDYAGNHRLTVPTRMDTKGRLWGKAVTIYTLRCRDCGTLSSQTLPGHSNPIQS